MNTKTETEMVESSPPAGNPVVDRSVYRPAPDALTPECIYFYVLTLTPTPKIKGYFFDNEGPISDVLGLIQLMAINSHYDLDMPPKMDGTVKWRRKSYFVMMLDDPTHNLTLGQAVVFADEDTNYKANYAFFEGMDDSVDISITPGNQEMRSVMYCKNHMMKDDQNTYLEAGDTHRYRFKVNYGRGVSRLEFDSGGTNMGPPSPPPAFF